MPDYTNVSLDQELKAQLIAIGEQALVPLGIKPSYPAIIRYLVRHYEQTSTKKGKS